MINKTGRGFDGGPLNGKPFKASTYLHFGLAQAFCSKESESLNAQPAWAEMETVSETQGTVYVQGLVSYVELILTFLT